MRRKNSNHQDSKDNHERWLISYADFITLLFAFFVVLYATSTVDNKKQNDFENSVKKYLLGATFVGTNAKSGTHKNQKNNAILENPIKKYSNTSAIIVRLHEEVSTQVENKIPSKMIIKYIKNIQNDDRGVQIILNASEVFKKNSAQVFKSADLFFSILVEILNFSESQIIIENHLIGTENPKPFQDIWQLSSARSTKLAQKLINDHGVKPDKVIPIGFANARPQVTSGNMDQNERLIITLNAIEI